MPYRIYQALEDEIVLWVRSVLGITAVEWDYQNAHSVGATPELTTTMAILSIFAPRTIARSDQEPNDGVDGSFKQYHHKQATISIKISAESGHLDLADSLVRSLDNPLEMNRFRAINTAINGSETIQDITSPLETKFRLTASVDFTVSWVKEVLLDLGEIRIIKDMTGDVGATSFDQTITHPDYS